jgi:hypothetical protein
MFSTKYNLNIHKQRTKKCLAIQNKNIGNRFLCEICDKTFTTNQSLKDHKINCSIHLNEFITLKQNIKILKEELFQKNEQIKDLQDKLAAIAEIGTKKDTYRLNVVNQLVPYDLSQEKIRNIVNEQFNENHLYARENGVVNFAVHNLLKDKEGNLKMTCTDTARKLFVYKDRDGNLYKDPNATEFLETYIPAVKRKSYEIISDKDGDEVIELTECILTIEPASLSNKLASKLISKPKNILSTINES